MPIDRYDIVRYGSDEFARMFAAAPVGMVRFERDGTMSAVNAGLARIVGQEIDELTGKNATSFIHPDDLDRQVRILTGLFRGRYDQSYGEVRLLHREGSTVFTKYGAAVMRDEEGVARHVITVVEDVTERNKLEIELRHAQKLESVWRLAAGIAHEINTPIQYVGDNLTFLETAVADLLGLVEIYQQLVAGPAAAAGRERHAAAGAGRGGRRPDLPAPERAHDRSPPRWTASGGWPPSCSRSRTSPTPTGARRRRPTSTAPCRARWRWPPTS